MTTVGFAGLGNMGGPMARNLAAAGYGVQVYDLVPELMQAVEGGQPRESAAAAAQGVEVFISMLPAGRHVAGLYLGNGSGGGVLEHLPQETLVIDCSTIDPATAQRAAAAASDRGLDMLDAPVSGGTAGAENGTLTFIVGGPEPALERARPLFDVMGANVFHAGGNGAGQIAKICNNMLLAVIDGGHGGSAVARCGQRSRSRGAVGDHKAILRRQLVAQCLQPLSRCHGGCTREPRLRRRLSRRPHDQGSRARHGNRRQSRSSVPMGSLAQNLYRVHEQVNNAGRLDFSSIQWLYKPEMAPRRDS